MRGSQKMMLPEKFTRYICLTGTVSAALLALLVFAFLFSLLVDRLLGTLAVY